jgi:hypothetical protein
MDTHMTPIKHINFTGSTNILGYSVTSLVADQDWSIFILESGMAMVVRGKETCYVGAAMWKTAEVVLPASAVDAAQGPLGSANVVATANLPAGLYRTTDGDLEPPVEAKPIHRARKTPKPQ